MKKSKKDLQVVEKQNKNFTAALSEELSNNLEYSLDVDPTDKYKMSEQQKTFIKNYCEFKSIPIAAELSKLDLDTAKAYFIAYSSQQEIRRINRAMYQRQFSHNLITIDELAGWLSSLITDEGIPIADRVKTMDKVKIAQILIDLQLYKNQIIEDPSKIINIDLENEIKDLSVKSIKALLIEAEKKDKKKDNKQELIDSMPNKEDLSIEEEVFLKTLPTKDLLQLLDLDKGGKQK